MLHRAFIFDLFDYNIRLFILCLFYNWQGNISDAYVDLGANSFGRFDESVFRPMLESKWFSEGDTKLNSTQTV